MGLLDQKNRPSNVLLKITVNALLSLEVVIFDQNFLMSIPS